MEDDPARLSQALATVLEQLDRFIANAFTELATNEVLGPYRAFINVDRELLFSDLIEALPPQLTALEINETIEPTDEVIARCVGEDVAIVVRPYLAASVQQVARSQNVGSHCGGVCAPPAVVWALVKLTVGVVPNGGLHATRQQIEEAARPQNRRHHAGPTMQIGQPVDGAPGDIGDVVGVAERRRRGLHVEQI